MKNLSNCLRWTSWISVMVLLTACSDGAPRPDVEMGLPVQLTDRQTYTVRDAVSEKFYLPRAVRMHPMSASKSTDEIITVCGLADALGQEGPTDAAIGYRAYIGMLAPDRELFLVSGLARSGFEQKAIFDLCRHRGAPIVIPAEVKAFASLAAG